MGDRERRAAERAAKADRHDDQAAERAAAAVRRAQGGRHADKLGSWVLIETVTCHFGGRLCGIYEAGGGLAYAQLHPCWFLPSTDETAPPARDGARTYYTTEAQPADVMLAAATVVVAADPAWVRHFEGA